MPTQWTAQKPGRVVQQHYVNARTHEINRQGQSVREQTVALFREDFAEKLKVFPVSLHNKWCDEAYDIVTRDLQERDLTINFNAKSWFLTPNTYKSYAQMYEKAGKDDEGRMVLKKGDDPHNPPITRVAADDFVTFPQHWNAPTAPANVTRGQMGGGGLRVGQQSTQRIMGRMMAGKHLMDQQAVEIASSKAQPGQPTGIGAFRAQIPQDNLTETSPGSGEYISPNARFNPKTKQVFAALNYGRRPHGSTVFYGHSHFVLAPSLKVNAIYFPCDTFILPSGAASQVSYQTLGAIYLKASPEKSHLRDELRKSQFNRQILKDAGAPHQMLEAHIFEPVTFAEHIAEMHLYLPSALKPEEKAAIRTNAAKFVEHWKIKKWDTDEQK
jgi:hypothetical protein